MHDDTRGEQTDGQVLDLRAVFGIVAHVTTPADATGGEYVEMEIEAEPGAKTNIHIHPEMDETYQTLSGTLDILYQGRWRSLGPGESLSVPRGAVHAFRNASDGPTRFMTDTLRPSASRLFWRRSIAW